MHACSEELYWATWPHGGPGCSLGILFWKGWASGRRRGRLCAPSDCSRCRRSYWPSGSTAEFHLCSAAQNVSLQIEFQSRHSYIFQGLCVTLSFLPAGVIENIKEPSHVFEFASPHKDLCLFSGSKLLPPRSFWPCRQQGDAKRFSASIKHKFLSVGTSQHQNPSHVRDGTAIRQHNRGPKQWTTTRHSNNWDTKRHQNVSQTLPETLGDSMVQQHTSAHTLCQHYNAEAVWH